MTVKKNIVCGFTELLSSGNLKNHKLILFTSAGMITGLPVTEEDINNEDSVASGFATLCKREVEFYKTENNLTESDYLPGNDGYFMLKDVEISTSVRNITIPIMIVFFDDIIGISLGES